RAIASSCIRARFLHLAADAAEFTLSDGHRPESNGLEMTHFLRQQPPVGEDLPAPPSFERDDVHSGQCPPVSRTRHPSRIIHHDASGRVPSGYPPGVREARAPAALWAVGDTSACAERSDVCSPTTPWTCP